MNEPQIAANSPLSVVLEQGKTYAWCACGHSKNQPWCDGSHRGTAFRPKVFTAGDSGDAWACRCKHTKNPPFCDGAHKTLPRPA